MFVVTFAVLWWFDAVEVRVFVDRLTESDISVRLSQAAAQCFSSAVLEPSAFRKPERLLMAKAKKIADGILKCSLVLRDAIIIYPQPSIATAEGSELACYKGIHPVPKHLDHWGSSFDFPFDSESSSFSFQLDVTGTIEERVYIERMKEMESQTMRRIPLCEGVRSMPLAEVTSV